MSDSSAIGCKPRGTLTPEPRYVCIHGHPWDSVPGLPCRQLQQMPATLAVFFLRLHFFTIIYRLYKSVHRWRTYIVRRTMHTTMCTLYTVQSVHFVHYPVSYIHYILWILWTIKQPDINCIMHIEHCYFIFSRASSTRSVACCILYTVHCIMYDYTLCTEQ